MVSDKYNLETADVKGLEIKKKVHSEYISESCSVETKIYIEQYEVGQNGIIKKK